jgi:hypothetical protein
MMNMERPSSELTADLADEARETVKEALRLGTPSPRLPLLPPFQDEFPPRPVGNTPFYVAGENDPRVKPLGHIKLIGEDGKEKIYRVGPLDKEKTNEEQSKRDEHERRLKEERDREEKYTIGSALKGNETRH